MTDSKKSRKKTNVPPWDQLQPRRHTTTTVPPARPTGSRRHIRNIPSKPRGAAKASDLYSKKKKNTAKPTQSTTPIHNPPPAQSSPLQRPVRAPPKSHRPHHPPVPPTQPQTVPFGAISVPSNSPFSKTPSFDVNTDIEPQLSKSMTIDSERWAQHPHAPYHNNLISLSYDNDDDRKQNTSTTLNTMKTMKAEPKRPPPEVEPESDVAVMYSKNIAGFEDKTLNEIDRCNIEALLGCMHEGSECLRHFQSALTTFAAAQQTQCAQFLRLFKKSKQRYAQMDTMPNFFYAIRLIHSLLEETVKQSSQFAKFIQISCLPMIRELEHQCDEKYKEIYDLTKAADKKLTDLQNEVEKSKKSTNNAAEKVLVARRKNEVYQNEMKLKSRPAKTHYKTTSKMSIISSTIGDMLTTGTNTESNMEEAYNLTKEYELKYKMAIAEYNAARIDYIKKRNRGKHEIINMEHFRVDSMLSVLQKVVKQQRKQYPVEVEQRKACKLYQLQEDVVAHTDSVTAKAVVSNFVNMSVETYGEWKPPQPMEWTCGIEYRDMFYSIEDAMSITLDINPHVKIPLIVPLLCGKIQELNGFKTEGIFRKSPNKTAMMRMKKRLQVKNFHLDEGNVHIYAGLLKEWLRGLKDLVIPKRYYDYCVSMAQEGKLNKQQFEVFFSQLPHVNRECLKYLIKFLRELLKKEYEKHTKMGLQNIAIVFGPTLLMPPHDLEASVAMKNAKSEKDFVISLIQNS